MTDPAPDPAATGGPSADWAAIPKIELHLHLEGAAPPEFVRRLAATKGVDLSGLFDAEGRYLSNDFTSFLRAYERVSGVFTTPADYAALTEAVLAAAAANGVIYAEIFLSPTSFGYDFGGWAEMLAAVEEGADRAEAAYGVLCRFIPVAIRHHDPALARDVAEAALAAPRGRVAGFGLAGDERMNAPGDYAGGFAAAKEAGLRLTAHAGEFGGPDSVRAALDDLGVERIGHGVRAAEDADLVKRLAAEGVTLETCPGSNVALGVYPDLAAHPVRRLADAGCQVTVSTDDPPFFHTTMAAEYEGLARVHGFDAAAFGRLGQSALRAAFCDEATKKTLAARLASADAGG
ncbi:MAG: adenosine deaminase [Pseudomonadota bacterium]